MVEEIEAFFFYLPYVPHSIGASLLNKLQNRALNIQKLISNPKKIKIIESYT